MDGVVAPSKKKKKYLELNTFLGTKESSEGEQHNILMAFVWLEMSFSTICDTMTFLVGFLLISSALLSKCCEVNSSTVKL